MTSSAELTKIAIDINVLTLVGSAARTGIWRDLLALAR